MIISYIQSKVPFPYEHFEKIITSKLTKTNGIWDIISGFDRIACVRPEL